MKSKILIRVEDAEANRRKLDTSWFKRRIRHSAGQHRVSVGSGAPSTSGLYFLLSPEWAL